MERNSNPVAYRPVVQRILANVYIELLQSDRVTIEFIYRVPNANRYLINRYMNDESYTVRIII